MRQALFIVLIFVSGSVGAQVINRAEYFIDIDPGKGNGTAVVVPAPSNNVNFSFTVPTISLTNGFHVLGFRSKESITGFWSHSMYNTFFVVPPASVPNAVNITKAEYFIDTDPGNGSGVNVAIGTVPNPTVAFTVPLTSLPAGFHTLHFRTRDNQNKWSIAHIQTFYIVPPTPGATSTNLVKAEYFFDVDPGQGNGNALTISSGATQTNSFPISINGLAAGFHRLNVRYKDNVNTWSHAHQQIFYITPQNSFSATNIVRVEYYVDTDPGYGLGTAATFTTGATVDLLPLAINTTGVPSGNHVLYVRAKDDKGFWSDISTGTFTISNCTPPTQPTVDDQSRCGAGTITLTATGATGTQQYRWYDDPIAGTQVGSGSPFTTPTLSASKMFYTTLYDPSTLCESSRVQVNATVVTFAKPILNTSGTITLCEGGSVFLQAPAGFNNYVWSNGETTQQITASLSGNYSVTVGDGSCFSVNSDPVNLTLITAPAKPTIQITGDICSGSPVVLSGPVGLAVYSWSTGANTQSITVNQSGTYSLSVKDALGCQSLSSDPVTIGNVATATITHVDNTLIASVGNSFQWFSFGQQIPGATKQILEISLFETEIIAVEITQGNCTTRSEDFIYLITEAESEINEIQVYPNPVTEYLTIKNSQSLSGFVSIHDALGKSLLVQSLLDGENNFDIKHYAYGSYWIVIKSADRSKVFKIQKQ